MIPKFYEGRHIFITGATGNVGKALLDKLLRSCNVGTIFVLLRPKKDKSIEERLEKFKQDKIFRRLAKEKPNEFNNKVVAIPGDVAEPMLGIPSDYSKRMENVSIIFHGAATVRFDEPLRKAIKLNVGGTMETIKFAETLKHLELFTHVSTFFCNPYLKVVEAKWYEPPMDWRTCLELSKRTDISDEILEGLTTKLITGFPNTYCFTKNIAEALVNDYRNKLPVFISRLPVVMCSVDDPEPGYTTSLVGAMGLFVLTGAGVLKAFYAAKDHRGDFTPLDTVIKSMLYHALKSAEIFASERRPTDIPVFQISSYPYTTMTTERYVSLPVEHGFWEKYAFEKNFLIPGVTFTDSRIYYYLLVIFKQILPAALYDLVLVLRGKKPQFMQVQRKIFTSMEVMKPFVFNTYESDGITFDKEMLVNLAGTEFHMDTLVRWKNLYAVVDSLNEMSYKVRDVVLNEDPSTLPKSRRIMQMKIIIYKIIQIVLAYKFYHFIKPKLFDWQVFDTEAVNDTSIYHQY